MYKNILVPISLDDTRDATQAIDVARLLVSEGAKITLLHVIEQIPAYVVSYLPQDYQEGRKAAILAELAQMAADVPGGRIEVVDGHSGRTILEWASEHEVDCVIITGHRPGMQDLLLGSTATQVVRHAACSVHVVR